MRPVPVPPGPGQESVWDYPRPPRVEPTTAEIEITLGGLVVARTTRALRVLETSHPPTYYLPADDFGTGVLRPTSGSSWCEWKGAASYFDVVAGGTGVEDAQGTGVEGARSTGVEGARSTGVEGARSTVARRAAWTYQQPSPGFEVLAGAVAVMPGAMDRCTVDGEVATPQEGGFYGGWVTAAVVGPFKGGPGTTGW